MWNKRDKQPNQPGLLMSAWINIINNQVKVQVVREEERKHKITCDVLLKRKTREPGEKTSLQSYKLKWFTSKSVGVHEYKEILQV